MKVGPSVEHLGVGNGLSQRAFRGLVASKVTEAEEKTVGGLLLTKVTKEKPSIRTATAVGPGPLDEERNRKPLYLASGSIVMYSNYAGIDFKGKDGYDYIALRVSDAMAVLS